MAIPITESQGTQAYLVAIGTSVATVANVETAITTAKQLGNITNIGNIGSSRNVTQYKVVDKDEVVKSIGSLSLGNLAIDLFYDGKDTAGQDDIRTAYGANTRRIMIVELKDEGTTNPSYLTFEVAFSSDLISITIDNAVMYKTVIEICSKPVLLEAV